MGKVVWWTLALALTGVLTAPALAFVFRGGDVVTMSEPVRDDLYVAGGTVTVRGPVDGDLVAAGVTVVLESPATGGVLAAGGTLWIRGKVGRGVRAAAGTVSVETSVGTDAVLAGRLVTLERGARVGRDLVAAGGTVRVLGEVGRRARLVGGTVFIGGSVAENVEVDADRVVLLPEAHVRGRLRYRSAQPAEVRPGARVEGGVVREPAARPPRDLPRRGGFPWVRWTVEALWLLTLGFAAQAVLPDAAARVSEETVRTGRSLLVGLVLLATVPVAAVLLVVTVVGVPLGLLALGLYAATLYLGQVFTGRRLGEGLLRRVLRASSVSPYAATAVGVLLLVALFALPWVGWVVRLTTALVGFGAIWLVVYRAASHR
jgi:cytoskeletal protein CcmA (bactofilin family)